MNESSTKVKRIIWNTQNARPVFMDALLWGKDVARTIRHEDRTVRSPFTHEMYRSDFDYDFMTRWVEKVGAGFGRIQDRECRQMKDSLLGTEGGEDSRLDGRVPLSTFYQTDVEGGISFGESTEYLRHIGALDESD